MTLTHYYRRLLQVLTGLCLAAIFMALFANSVSRYAFSSSILWAGDFAKYMMIYGTMFGTSLAYLEGRQINLNLVTDLLPNTVVDWLAIPSHLLTGVVGTVLAYSGYTFYTTRGNLVSPSLGVPMAYAQFAMFLGGILLTITALLCLLEAIRHLRHKQVDGGTTA